MPPKIAEHFSLKEGEKGFDIFTDEHSDKYLTHLDLFDLITTELQKSEIEGTPLKLVVDGDYGFGGTCFPKDINALIETMVENGITPLLLTAVWNQNKIIRKKWDWADKSSAVSDE